MHDHAGHENMHAEMMLILMVTMVVGQVVLVVWRTHHFKSYQTVTLIGMYVLSSVHVRGLRLRLCFRFPLCVNVHCVSISRADAVRWFVQHGSASELIQRKRMHDGVRSRPSANMGDRALRCCDPYCRIAYS
jgi:hypothetical protein